MTRFVLAALLGPLLGTPALAHPPSLPGLHAPCPQKGLGGSHPAPWDTPAVLEAKHFLQSQLAAMTLETILEAEVQVVAGLRVQLTCETLGEDGPATWRLVACRTADGRWHFQSAQRLDAFQDAEPPQSQPLYDSGCYI